MKRAAGESLRITTRVILHSHKRSDSPAARFGFPPEARLIECTPCACNAGYSFGFPPEARLIESGAFQSNGKICFGFPPEARLIEYGRPN